MSSHSDMLGQDEYIRPVSGRYCVGGILLHFPCPRLLAAFSTLSKELPEPFLICQVSETVKPIRPAFLSHT